MSHILRTLEFNNSVIGKDIKVVLKKRMLDEKEVTGKCLSIPPPVIIRSLYQDIFPTLSVSVENNNYVAHISIINIENIYKIRVDNTSKVLTTLICKHKNISTDVSRYITTFMEGWTIDTQLC
jgi:hypothetical protein